MAKFTLFCGTPVTKARNPTVKKSLFVVVAICVVKMFDKVENMGKYHLGERPKYGIKPQRQTSRYTEAQHTKTEINFLLLKAKERP